MFINRKWMELSKLRCRIVDYLLELKLKFEFCSLAVLPCWFL